MTPQAGVRITHVSLGGFSESGSELALNVNRFGHSASSAIARVDFAMDPRSVAGWSVTPTATLGVEVAFGNTLIASTASLYGIAIAQYAAFDSRYLLQSGVGVIAQKGAWGVQAGVNVERGAHSNGVNGQVSVAYRF